MTDDSDLCHERLADTVTGVFKIQSNNYDGSCFQNYLTAKTLHLFTQKAPT